MFQNVLMLMGLGAAVVPLVLHLLSRARYRTVDWGAMMFLRGADARQRQSTRFSQILLVSVRMALIALLAVALAKPVVRGSWIGAAQPGPVTTAIVLDCSASMAFEENGRSRFELARGAARQVLAGLRRGDRAILVLTGSKNNEAQDLRATTELRVIDARLAMLRPGNGRADLAAALRIAWEKLAEVEPIQRQIFVITDRQALSWNGITAAQSNWTSPWLNQSRESRVPTEGFIIPVGNLEADNIVIESVELLDPPAIRGQPVDLEVRLRNYGSVQRAALPLVVRFGDRKVFETKVNLAADSEATFKA
jgi:hypothetical protein